MSRFLNILLNSLIEMFARIFIVAGVLFVFSERPELNKHVPAILIFVLFTLWAVKGAAGYIEFTKEEPQ